MPNQGDNVKTVKRAITVFFLLDKSGSMAGERIAKLNQAIPVTIDALHSVQDDNPNLRIVVKVMEFSDSVSLSTGENAQELDNFNWRDLEADGRTATASAINLLCDHLDIERMPKRGYPPVAVLVSDGYCTESDDRYNAAIDRLNNDPWGKRAARIVVSIGDDIDEEALRRFVNANGSYINCLDAADIVEYIRTKTTEATLSNSESRPVEEAKDDDGGEDAQSDNAANSSAVNPDELF